MLTKSPQPSPFLHYFILLPTQHYEVFSPPSVTPPRTTSCPLPVCRFVASCPAFRSPTVTLASSSSKASASSTTSPARR
eukprot:3998248-Pleurochrysis_carterae.AAC.1